LTLYNYSSANNTAARSAEDLSTRFQSQRSALHIPFQFLPYMECPNKSAIFKVRALWGTFVGYCVRQLIAVCVLYTEIKISALFE